MINLSGTALSTSATVLTPNRRPIAVKGAPPLFGGHHAALPPIAPDAECLIQPGSALWGDNGTILEQPLRTADGMQGLTMTIASTTARRVTPVTNWTMGRGVPYLAAAVVAPTASDNGRLYLLRTSTNHVRVTAANLSGGAPSVSLQTVNTPNIVVDAAGVDLLEDGLRRIWARFTATAAQDFYMGVGTAATNNTITVFRAGFSHALPAFTVADAVAPAGDSIWIDLDPAWSGWAVASRVDCAVNGVVVAACEEPGAHLVGGLKPGEPCTVRIRAVYAEADVGVKGGVITEWSEAA